MPDNERSFELPEDLTGITDEDLASHLAAIREQGQTLLAGEHSAETIAQLSELADAQDALVAEQTRRADEAEQTAAEVEALRGRFETPEAEGGGDEQKESGQQVADAPKEPALVASTSRPKTKVEDVIKDKPRRLNYSLKELQDRAPEQQAPKRHESVLVASSDIPGFTLGGKIDGMDKLVAAMSARAKAAAVTALGENAPRIPVAQLQREYRHYLDMNATPEQINRVLEDVANPEVLVAAGGWCAPSEISYDFYNIICEDGMVDLPTTGINRGGMRWPTSPSFADVVSVPWTWTETMDIAAATGTAQSGTKPCVRVPCAGMNEARLSADGICITAGNFTTDAWPEQLANYIRLVEASQAHYTNSRIIASLVAQSTVVVTGSGAAGAGVVSPVLSAVDLQAQDYREKYRMCEDAVLEAIFPRWIIGPIRADLSRRMGISIFNVTMAMVREWFDGRNVRAQFVADWQNTVVGGAVAPNFWPTTVNFLLYAAGTFVRGNGLTLDLGIVRDSTLNAVNDYTAAWMEEAYLVARVGHESRLVTVPICADGTTGAADLTACL